jgi:hypothetical protein
MIDMLTYFLLIAILGLITGALVKYADFLEDTKKEKNKLKLVLIGLLYGISIFVMIYFFPVVAPIWLGTILGVIIFGKIDSISHNTGVSVSIALTLAFTKALFGTMVLFFFIINILEEFVNDYFDKNKVKNKKLQTILSSRLLLEVSAFLFSLFTGLWEVWIAILCFDISYQIITVIENEQIQNRKKSTKKKRK